MPSNQEKIQRLLQYGVRSRPPGSFKRFGVYLDSSLVEMCEDLGVFKRKTDKNGKISFSLWIERQLIIAIQEKKSSQ